jgi:TetR/AcrR family transcriptional regulator, cholesterol catabolism regulator
VAAAPETLTLSRRLSKEQAARRAGVVDAARALAREGGYPAVTMQAVAARAGASRATLYRWFASKDHLLGEVALAWGAELTAALRERPLAANARAERVAEVLLFVLRAARAEPRLTGAVLAAATSPDPEALRAGSELGSLVGNYLGVALGDEAQGERDELAQLLGHVFFSALVHMTSGRLSPDAADAAVRAAARRLFPEGALP